jgi:putative membrane protein
MLFHDAALSYLHFIFAFLLAGALASEAFVLRLPVDGRVARLLLRIDIFYAVGAVGVIAAGVSRVFWGAKGVEYYALQPIFWAKMITIALVGLLSIAPTRTFFAWVKQAGRDGAGFSVADADAQRVRRLVIIELLLFALIPLFAALMSRGIGI